MAKRAMPPLHPGRLFRNEIITAQQLTVTKVAQLLGVSRIAISNIVNERAAISPEMAVRIATVFGGTADIWVQLQTKYDLQKAEEKIRKLHLKPYKHTA
ncbi:HigA family addiction module antidote protein [Chitinophaga agrisoli]|uniref:HigA family addiction module antidote protein n=1 Tax=Chitinophaga agrisoli TaxID=2607653 RepID=A0A5B2VLM7_9BACT|nr:HigA family addiction module antitoxin [Chitinophaga agrisoli]KAA2239550.1 HigA family addiction module antidote protein [Chitinophaga agrisoli]